MKPIRGGRGADDDDDGSRRNFEFPVAFREKKEKEGSPSMHIYKTKLS